MNFVVYLIPIFLLLLNISNFFQFTLASEFIFEVHDKRRQCFYESLIKNEESAIDFQVISGGNYDVDVVVFNPSGGQLYNKARAQYDTYKFTPDTNGIYRICFSNEFSQFSHKRVFLNWSIREYDNIGHSGNASDDKEDSGTLVDGAVTNIYQALTAVENYQTHARNRESSHRLLAEDLNWLVLLWSLIQTGVIILVCFGEILILRSFFTDRINNKSHGRVYT